VTHDRPMSERDHRLNVRMTPEEARLLRVLAEEDGISQSDWIRMIIRRTFIERFPSQKPKAKKR
jgi:hypothetical protein